MAQNAPKSIKSVSKSYDIIDALLDLQPAGVSELADEVDLHPSTTHAHLASLHHCGLVAKDGSQYELSLQFLQIGGRLQNERSIYVEGKDEIKQLAWETGEMTNMAVREGSEIVVIHMEEGENAVDKQTPLGKRNPFHCTGMGKAMLAELPEEEVNEIVDDVGLPRRTPETITTRAELAEDLERIREQGYALDRNELYEGIYCIASSMTKNDELVGAISVTGPTNRFSEQEYQEQLTEKLLETANIIEINLRFHT